ncbi:hypothetical protein [Paraburkholderia sp. BL10I2N1]|uniref:hypothetical protein n=1 Tax=Paraburkholderia sp. BL10I2N1 TaxID=1938796 RepID=UPI0010E466BC|nr:hypothetical protein [Paraburkholderia sp. BL10I2N1]TDN70219.1 hypothetical protein B0G77_3677 [Paraburkholderia sp. BL10I2N1]
MEKVSRPSGAAFASVMARASAAVRRVPPLMAVAPITPLEGGMQLDQLHDTFLRTN